MGGHSLLGGLSAIAGSLLKTERHSLEICFDEGDENDSVDFSDVRSVEPKQMSVDSTTETPSTQESSIRRRPSRTGERKQEHAEDGDEEQTKRRTQEQRTEQEFQRNQKLFEHRRR